LLNRQKLKNIYSNNISICNSRPTGTEEKRPLGILRRRWVDNIKMDLRQIGWDGVDWIDMAQDRDKWRALANTVLNLRFP
jgi:hypothetical protein